MDAIKISEFKAKCLAILAKVERTNSPVVITKRGRPVARILPPDTPEKKSWLGCMSGTAHIVGDIVSPDPADENLWTADAEDDL
jgi:prevent-host-death family protein